MARRPSVQRPSLVAKRQAAPSARIAQTAKSAAAAPPPAPAAMTEVASAISTTDTRA